MELAGHIQKYPENDDGYLDIIDDYDSTLTRHNGALSQTTHGVQGKVKTNVEGREKSDNGYEIPVIYSEILDADYESLHPQPRNTSTIKTAQTSPPESKSISTQTLAEEPKQKSCCRKSPCLWGLLTAAITVIIAVLLVIFLTGSCFVYIPF